MICYICQEPGTHHVNGNYYCSVHDPKRAAIEFICSNCGGFGNDPTIEDLDSGMVLVCHKCQGKTIVMLFTEQEHTAYFKMRELLRELVGVSVVTVGPICCSVTWDDKNGLQHQPSCPWRRAKELLEVTP